MLYFGFQNPVKGYTLLAFLFLFSNHAFAIDEAGLLAAGFKNGRVYQLTQAQHSAYCADKFKLEILDVNEPYGPTIYVSFKTKMPEWKGNFVWSHFPALDDPTPYISSGQPGVSNVEEEYATYNASTKTINKHFIRKNKDGVVKNDVLVAFSPDPTNSGGLVLSWIDSVGSMGSMECHYSELNICYGTTREWSLDIDNIVYKLFFLDRYPIPANGNNAMGPNYNYNATIITETNVEIPVPIANAQHWSMFTTMMKSVYKTKTIDENAIQKPATAFLVGSGSNIVMTDRHAFEDFNSLELFAMGSSSPLAQGYPDPMESNRATASCNLFAIIARDATGNLAVSHCNHELVYCPLTYDACFIKMSNFESGSGSLSGQPLSAAGAPLSLKRNGFASDHDVSIFLNTIGNVSDKGLQGSRGKGYSMVPVTGTSIGQADLRYVHFATGPGGSGAPAFGDDEKVIGLVKEGALSNILASDHGSLRVPVVTNIKGILDKVQAEKPDLYNDLNIVN